MSIAFYDRDGLIAGTLEDPLQLISGLRLSEAAETVVTAPYATWRDQLPADFRMYLVVPIGPKGEQLPLGRWITINHSKVFPGTATAGVRCLLEELREGSLPEGYYVSYRPVLSIIEDILNRSGTDWVLGDTSTASNGYITANLATKTHLGAIVELCAMTGNYFRHDGVSRVLDILTEPLSPDPVATCVSADADLEYLPATYGYIEDIQGDIDTSEIVRAAYPEGGEQTREDGSTEPLRLTGKETLPTGFAFQRIDGGLAIVNTAVSSGLVRNVRFSAISPLSNTEVSVTGTSEGGGIGTIICEALNRPNNDFWTGGIMTTNEVEYNVNSHIGARISGNWSSAYPVGQVFQVTRSFDYDFEKVQEAQQVLADAVVGHLMAMAGASFQVTLQVRGLSLIPLPGQYIRIECAGHVLFEDALTMYRQLYSFEQLTDDFVVISVEMDIRPSGIIYNLTLSDQLRLLPTEEGVRELYGLMQQNAAVRKRILAVVGDTEPSLVWPGMLWVDTGT